MKFNIIDEATWDRKEYFEYYHSNVPCTYSKTVEVDITNILLQFKDKKLKLYPFMISGISNIVNRHREFRMAMDENNNIGYYEAVTPNYTIFHKDTETFTTRWTEYDNEFQTFYNNYVEDMNQFRNIKRMILKPLKEKISLRFRVSRFINELQELIMEFKI